MDDVVNQVGFGGGDEPLDALQVPTAVLLQDRLGAAGADVAAGIGLGQHHGRAPLFLDHGLGHPLLQRGAVAVYDNSEVGSARVHEQGGIGAEDQLCSGPAQARGRSVAAEVGREFEPLPVAVDQRPVGLLEGVGHFHAEGGRIVDGRVAVRVRERGRDRPGGDRLQLVQDLPRGIGAHLRETAGAHPLAGAQYLEQVELEISDVGTVMSHGRCSLVVRLLADGSWFAVHPAVLRDSRVQSH